MSNPLGPLHAVRTISRNADPAVDWKATGQADYQRSRDFASLKLKPGMSPAVFVLAPLSRKFVTVCLDGIDNKAHKHAVAFLASCHEVKMPDGTSIRPAKITESAYETPMAGDDWSDQVADEFGMDTVEEMGAIAVERARLPKGAQGPFAWRGML